MDADNQRADSAVRGSVRRDMIRRYAALIAEALVLFSSHSQIIRRLAFRVGYRRETELVAFLPTCSARCRKGGITGAFQVQGQQRQPGQGNGEDGIAEYRHLL